MYYFYKSRTKNCRHSRKKSLHKKRANLEESHTFRNHCGRLSAKKEAISIRRVPLMWWQGARACKERVVSEQHYEVFPQQS
ncbi:hypothetical protein CEXT_156261 [Caerostris extrusa]|uniref:Uncharacterized protein n=1 Tax=Caerostris extrusa TaxID=172846 RepID=A0AAV4Y2K4_CAEEX|nr:hypothetical protein CEXT_156261 [Caerostris extrusa]